MSASSFSQSANNSATIGAEDWRRAADLLSGVRPRTSSSTDQRVFIRSTVAVARMELPLTCSS